MYQSKTIFLGNSRFPECGSPARLAVEEGADAADGVVAAGRLGLAGGLPAVGQLVRHGDPRLQERIVRHLQVGVRQVYYQIRNLSFNRVCLLLFPFIYLQVSVD